MTTELRRDRREKQKRQRQRQQQKRRSSGGISSQIVVGIFVLGAIALAILGARAAGIFEPAAAAFDLNSSEFQVPAGSTIGTQEPLLQPEHIVPPAKGNYNTVPPTSGQHWNQAGLAPATWGIKDSNLPNEVTTHNLEHGGVVIAYNNLTPTETDQLKGIVRTLMNGTYRKIILEPYPALTDSKIALTSWGWLLKLQNVDQIQIVQFTRAHYSDPNFAPEWNVQ
jgi:Protein of unknown function (DUF3105)